MLEVGFIRLINVAVDERPVSIRIGNGQSIQLAQNDRLNHREPFLRAVCEIARRFVPI